MGLDRPPTIDAAALTALRQYPFPGNVRELENVLERAMTLCDGEHIGVADLQLRDSGSAPSVAAAAALENQLEEVEKRAIREALEKTRYNKTRAAELLGMSFRALRYRIKKLHLDEAE